MSRLRGSFEALLRERGYSEVERAVTGDRGAFRTVMGLLYHEEPLVRWRAVTMLGVLAVSMPELVKPAVKRLLWFMNEESSTVGWGSAQAIGEIYRRSPEVAKDAVRVVVHFLDDEEVSAPANRNTPILAGSIWTIGNIAGVDPGLAAEMGPALTGFLKDPDPEIRGLAAWALGRTGYAGAEAGLGELLEDDAPAEIYEDENLRTAPVKEIAAGARSRIKQK